jgi:hypothetical protein
MLTEAEFTFLFGIIATCDEATLDYGLRDMALCLLLLSSNTIENVPHPPC